jgi:hypothetical protein
MAALDLGAAEGDGLAAAAAGGFALSPLQVLGSSGGSGSAAAVSFTLSLLQLVYLSDPWSTGSELYGDVAGTLQVRGGSGGVAGGSATPLLQGFHSGVADGRASGFASELTLSKLNLLGVAGAGTLALAQLGGLLQVAGVSGGVCDVVGPLSGAGNPIALAAGSSGVGAGAAVLTGPYSMPARSDAGGSVVAGGLGLGIGIGGSAVAGSVPAASLRINADHEGEADGAGSGSATMSALAQLAGLSGRDGWQRPQLEGSGGGIAGVYAVVSIAGPVTVSLAGSS